MSPTSPTSDRSLGEPSTSTSAGNAPEGKDPAAVLVEAVAPKLGARGQPLKQPTCQIVEGSFGWKTYWRCKHCSFDTFDKALADERAEKPCPVKSRAA